MDSLPDEILGLIADDDLTIIDTLRAVCGRFRAAIPVPPLIVDGNPVADGEISHTMQVNFGRNIRISRGNVVIDDVYVSHSGDRIHTSDIEAIRVIRYRCFPLYLCAYKSKCSHRVDSGHKAIQILSPTEDRDCLISGNWVGISTALRVLPKIKRHVSIMVHQKYVRVVAAIPGVVVG